MTADAPSALGALFGPDFIMVTVDDDNKTQYSLEVYPDANNPLLKANGIAMQFYFVPQRVYVAKKQDSPGDFDFGMTVFKGLMTTEDTVGVTAGQTSGGDVEVGGGFCVFSTTFAIPDSVIANATKALQSKQYQGSQPNGSVSPRLQQYLNIEAADPPPVLGIIPILSNSVYIDVPQLSMSNPSAGSGTPASGAPASGAPASGAPASGAAAPAGSTTPPAAANGASAGTNAASSAAASTAPVAPTSSATAATLQISAQSAQKGSIEAKGISSFLVTCNELAAGAIAGGLQAGMSPFTVFYNLTEQFYLAACDINVTIDVDKVYDSFSVAASASGFFSSASFQGAWSNCVTNGAVVTDMKINEAAVPDDLKSFIDQECQQMQQFAMNTVKDQIFDWNPTNGGDATTSGGGGLFGWGGSISMKANYQRRGIKFTQELKLDTTVTMADTKSGDLSDLEPAIKANLSKYLAIVDIGQYFSKVQVAATNAINWNETLPNGTSLADPLSEAMIEVGYPDYSQPMGANNQVNLQTLGQGYHYTVGQATGQSGLAMWNSTNPADVINISFLRLDAKLAQWPQDQVHIRKTLVFDANDPRVDLSNNQTTVVIENDTSDHTPILTGQEVGYVFAKFACRPIPAAITLTLTVTLGPRTDTITLNAANQGNALWEIFSDKYVALDSFTYSIAVQVQGPDWTDTPITYQSAQPVTVPLPSSRVKYVPLCMLQLPDVPAAQVSQINDYIRRYQLQPAGAA